MEGGREGGRGGGAGGGGGGGGGRARERERTPYRQHCSLPASTPSVPSAPLNHPFHTTHTHPTPPAAHLAGPEPGAARGVVRRHNDNKALRLERALPEGLSES